MTYLWLFLLPFSGADHTDRGLTYVAAEKLESVHLYGNLDEYAYWYLDMLVGSPAQRTSVIVDTGSSVSAFSCNTCTHCGNHIDKAFNFTASSSATWDSCSSTCPGSCLTDHCSYRVSYSEGSSLTGFWFTDFVQLGDVSESNIAVTAHLGCHQSETNLFYSQAANGIMGLAPARSGSYPNLLSALFSDDRVNKSIFALCLSPNGGDLTVGGYNATHLLAAVSWTPLKTDTFYSINIDSIMIGTSPVGGRFGGRIIVDSGTTFVYFPQAVFKPLNLVIQSVVSTLQISGTRCFSMDASSVASFPILTFVLNGGATIDWAPSEYLFTHKGTYCLAFEQNGASSETVLGAAWMINKNLVFDYSTEKRFGIASASCPTYVQRPPSTVPTVSTPTQTVTAASTVAEVPSTVSEGSVSTESPSSTGVTEAFVLTSESPSSAEVSVGALDATGSPTQTEGSSPLAWTAFVLLALVLALVLWQRQRRTTHSGPFVQLEEVNVLVGAPPVNDIEGGPNELQPIKFSIK